MREGPCAAVTQKYKYTLRAAAAAGGDLAAAGVLVRVQLEVRRT